MADAVFSNPYLWSQQSFHRCKDQGKNDGRKRVRVGCAKEQKKEFRKNTTERKTRKK